MTGAVLAGDLSVTVQIDRKRKLQTKEVWEKFVLCSWLG